MLGTAHNCHLPGQYTIIDHDLTLLTVMLVLLCTFSSGTCLVDMKHCHAAGFRVLALQNLDMPHYL